MRIRTFLGLLLALVVVGVASYLTNRNIALLSQQFQFTDSSSVPLFAVLGGVFLLGFLPTAGVLLVQTLKRELARRRERRRDREARSLQGIVRRAIDLEADGQWGKAATEFELALAEQPEDFATLLRYGEVLRHQGRAEEALQIHRRASVLYPQSVALLYQLAEDYEGVGERDVAQEIRNRVLRDFPGLGLPVLRRRRNRALAAGDWREASRLQERIDGLLEDGLAGELEREEGVRRGLRYQRAVELLEGERVAEAVAVFEQILAEEPRFIPAAIMLGEAELLRERDDEAVGRWRNGYQTTGSPVFLQRIEDHFIEREAPVQAIETLHSLIATADNDLLPRFYLGRLYYRLEMHEEALAALEVVRERIQFSPTYYLVLARIHERRGEMAKAVECYLACARQAGVAAAEYRCRVCRASHAEWRDRCDGCGSWNSIELDFEEEKVSAEEMGIREAPVWSVTDDELEETAADTDRVG